MKLARRLCIHLLLCISVLSLVPAPAQAQSEPGCTYTYLGAVFQSARQDVVGTNDIVDIVKHGHPIVITINPNGSVSVYPENIPAATLAFVDCVL